jgi:hypothetical protein
MVVYIERFLINKYLKVCALHQHQSDYCVVDALRNK